MKPRLRHRPGVAALLAAVVLAPLAAADRAPEKIPVAAPEPVSAAPPGGDRVTPPAATKANPTSPSAAGEKAGEKKQAEKKKETNPAAKPPPALPLSPRFLQVRDRVGLLYGNRDVPPPPIDARHNPFRSQPIAAAPAATPASGGAPVAPGAGGASAALPGGPVAEPAPPPVNPGIALVRQAAALLRVTGFVERDGRTLLNINQALYREGETVKVAVKGQTVLLRIKKLSRTSLTVSLGEVEHTINF